MSSISTTLTALAGGLIPALVWLWFWLQEDRHPEPKWLIFFTFIAGMVVVLAVLPIEKWVITYFSGFLVILLWAAAEEILKLVGAYLVALRRKAMNEPIDALIYMITIALGFAALENTLFLFNILQKGDIITYITTGNFRFIGATLLHILSSSAIGGAIALSFYKSKIRKFIYISIGVVLSIAIHTIFNFFITLNQENILLVFTFVWAGIIILIIFFEKVRRIRRKKKQQFSTTG